MMKTILFAFLFLSNINANEQIILVLADDFNSTQARLYTYEKNESNYKKVFSPLTVNLGRSGLAWGIGLKKMHIKANEPRKKEGDGKAPAGIFELTSSFGYATTFPTKLPYLQADKHLVCVDDSNSKAYNTLTYASNPKEIYQSFEWMKRDDNLYEIGVVVAHNSKAIAKKGSCIFLHVQKADASPTSGCTSMPYKALKKIMMWLDTTKKPLLIQVPKAYCSQLPYEFEGLPCE